jgi:hypothetical protein
LVTFSPSAATLVVQEESCAKALGATTKTPTKDNHTNVNSLLTNVPLPVPPVVAPHNLNETNTRGNTNPPSSSLQDHDPVRCGLLPRSSSRSHELLRLLQRGPRLHPRPRADVPDGGILHVRSSGPLFFATGS